MGFDIGKFTSMMMMLVVVVVDVVVDVVAEAVSAAAGEVVEVLAVLARPGLLRDPPTRALADPAEGVPRDPAGVRGLRWEIALQEVGPVEIGHR